MMKGVNVNFSVTKESRKSRAMSSNLGPCLLYPFAMLSIGVLLRGPRWLILHSSELRSNPFSLRTPVFYFQPFGSVSWLNLASGN